jgi:hypothetical protein
MQQEPSRIPTLSEAMAAIADPDSIAIPLGRGQHAQLYRSLWTHAAVAAGRDPNNPGTPSSATGHQRRNLKVTDGNVHRAIVRDAFEHSSLPPPHSVVAQDLHPRTGQVITQVQFDLDSATSTRQARRFELTRAMLVQPSLAPIPFPVPGADPQNLARFAAWHLSLKSFPSKGTDKATRSLVTQLNDQLEANWKRSFRDLRTQPVLASFARNIEIRTQAKTTQAHISDNQLINER